jgi:flagellar hook assembly protein FlgD
VEFPKRYALYQCAPNPFNPTTLIKYDVPPGDGNTTIRMYDIAGRVVHTLVDGHESADRKTVTWRGRNDRGEQVATGIYFCRMQAPGYTKTFKMMLLK